MFEHMFGNKLVTQLLSKELEQGVLPSALLCYGQRFSGRMTLSLEIARMLSCRQNRLSACRCKHCVEHALLDYPYLMLLPQREHTPEISAALDTLSREKSSNARKVFVRSIRLLIRGYHSAFLESAPQSRRGNFTLASEIDELLEDILTFSLDTQFDEVVKTAKKAAAQSKKLDSGSKNGLPVSYIRSIASWLHATSQDEQRIVILEGVDEMNEAAANSLLKILEEPPEGVTFILLAETRHSILPTILSRVRAYHMQKRSREEEAAVITQVYGENIEDYGSLLTFFREKQGINCNEVRKQAEDFLLTALKRRVVPHLHIQEIISAISTQNLSNLFCQELSYLLSREFADGYITVAEAEPVMHYVQETVSVGEQYNQNRSLTLESLFYRIRGTV
ncbi:MAG: hypothetical protein ACQEQU_03785 [Spirochaetota bacterium]